MLNAQDYFSYFDAVNNMTLISHSGWHKVSVDDKGHFYSHPHVSKHVILPLLCESIRCVWDKQRLEQNQHETNKKFGQMIKTIHHVNGLHKKMRRFFKQGLFGLDEENVGPENLYVLRALRLYTMYTDFFQKWNERVEAYVESQRPPLLDLQINLMQSCGLFPTFQEAELLKEMIVEGVGFRKKHEKIALPMIHKPLCEMFVTMCQRLRKEAESLDRNEGTQHALSCLKILGGIFSSEAAAKYASSKLRIKDPNLADLVKHNAMMAYLNPYLDKSAIEDYIETLRSILESHTGAYKAYRIDFHTDIAPLFDIIVKTTEGFDEFFDILEAIRHHLERFHTEIVQWIARNLINNIEEFCHNRPETSFYRILIWIKQGLDILEEQPQTLLLYKAEALLLLHRLTKENPSLIAAARLFSLRYLTGPTTPQEMVSNII